MDTASRALTVDPVNLVTVTVLPLTALLAPVGLFYAALRLNFPDLFGPRAEHRSITGRYRALVPGPGPDETTLIIDDASDLRALVAPPRRWHNRYRSPSRVSIDRVEQMTLCLEMVGELQYLRDEWDSDAPILRIETVREHGMVVLTTVFDEIGRGVQHAHARYYATRAAER